MKKRLAFMAVWLLGTVASIVLAWSAVSVVGGQVTDDADGALSAKEVAERVANTALQASDSSSGPGTRVTMAALPVATTTAVAPATAPTTVSAVPPVSVETSSRGPSNTTQLNGGSSAPTVGTTTPSTPVTEDRSTDSTVVSPSPTTANPGSGSLQYFQANGGTTGMRCNGDAAALAFATPGAGWTMVVHDSGPEKVDVEFEHDQDRRSRVIVRCNGGTATAEVKER